VRLDVAVQTNLRFHTEPPGFAPPAERLGRPTTVGIEFDGRLFVWHDIPSTPAEPPFPEFSYAPVITVVYASEVDRDSAANDLAAFVSALVFRYELPIELVTSYYLGGSGESDSFHPAMQRVLAHGTTATVVSAPKRVGVNPEAKLALAVYRQGVNVASPYLRFFGLWSVLDAVFPKDREAVNRFVDAEATRTDGVEDYVRDVMGHSLPDQDAADYLRDHARNPIAHVIRDRHDQPHINPDDDATRFRLAGEAYWLQAVARRAITGKWPDAVTTVERT
jgi:hypothetical protein